MAKPGSFGVKINGIRELHRALKAADRDLAKEIDAELRAIADVVATDARARFSAIDAKSASAFRPRVRGFGRVVVETQKRKVTGLRPDYGALIMERALIPARTAHRAEVIRGMETMIDRLASQNGF